MEKAINPYKKFKKMYIVDKTGEFKGKHEIVNNFETRLKSSF